MYRFSRNMVFLLGASIGNSLMAFLFAAYATQRLTALQFGKFSTVQIFVTSLTVLTEIGLMQVVIREVAQNKEQTAYITGNIIALKAVLGIAGFIIAILLAQILRYDAETQILIFIYSLSLILLSISNAAVAIFTGHEAMVFSTVINWGTAGGNLVSILMLFLGYGLIPVFISLVSCTFLATFVSIAILRLKFSVLRFFIADLSLWKKYLSISLQFGLIAVIGTIGVSLGPIMLSRMTGELEVGYFNAAFKIINIPNLLIMAYNLAIYPVFSRLYLSQKKLQQGYVMSLKILVILGLPVAVGLTVLADKLMLLAFPDYMLAVPALQILIWFWFFSLLATPTLNLLYAEKCENKVAIVLLIASTICLLLNFILIPRFGFIGVCVALVVLTFIQFLGGHFAVAPNHQVPGLPVFILKIIFLSFIIGCLGIIFHAWNLLILIFFMAAIWLLSFILLQLFDAEEWEIVAEVPMIAKFRHVVMRMS